MSALSQCYDVQRVPMVGSSGGGLVALLGACEVAPQEAVARAFALCREAGVYERPLGLFGIWRGLVHRWLSDLLPADAPARCARVGLVVTQLPYLQPVRLSGWQCRRDLIDAALASAHVPLLLDGRPATRCRGEWVLDGNLHYGWLGREEELVPTGCPAVVFDPRHDSRLAAALGARWAACLRSLDGGRATELVELGREYGQRVAASGQLDGAGLEEFRRQPKDTAKHEGN